MEQGNRKRNPGAVLWCFSGSVPLALVLLFLLAADLSLAYFFIIGKDSLFEPMNQVGLLSWLNTYGRANLPGTAWFFLLLLLLSGLAINTLICTGTRLWKLIGTRRQGKQGSGKRLYFVLSTHAMHLGMVAILLGYLISYTMSRVYPGQTLALSREASIAGTNLRVEVMAMHLPVYSGNRLQAFQGRVIRPEVQLRITSPTGERTSFMGLNDPIYFQGYTLFLQRFAPKSMSGMDRARYIVIDVRRDPGVWLYFSGILLFLSGLSGYVCFQSYSRSTKELFS